MAAARRVISRMGKFRDIDEPIIARRRRGSLGLRCSGFVERRDVSRGQGSIPDRYLVDAAGEEPSCENRAFANRELTGLLRCTGLAVIRCGLAVPVDGPARSGGVHGGDDHVPLIDERVRVRRIAYVAAGSGVKPQGIVRLELKIEVVTRLRFS